MRVLKATFKVFWILLAIVTIIGIFVLFCLFWSEYGVGVISIFLCIFLLVAISASFILNYCAITGKISASESENLKSASPSKPAPQSERPQKEKRQNTRKVKIAEREKQREKQREKEQEDALMDAFIMWDSFND